MKRLLAALLTVGLCSAAHAQDVDRSADLRLVWVGAPADYDPPYAKNQFQNMAYTLPIYDGLVRLDVNGGIVPNLAESWTFSDDGLTLTMHLRDGVKFTDGSDLTADVVVKSLKRTKEDPASTLASQLGSFASFEAADPKTVVLHLSTPDASALYPLTTNAGMIVSAQALDGGVDLKASPVGTGPYKLVSSGPDGAVYERNDGYFDQSQNQFAKLEISAIRDTTARLNAILTGEADAGLFQVDQGTYPQIQSMVASGAFTVDSFVQPNSLPMWMNTKIKPFDDPRVRMALNLAIDRNAISQGLQLGACRVAQQPIPPGVIGHNESLPPYPYDVERAKALLAEAGVGEFSFDALVPSAEPYASVGVAMKDQLSKIGVTMNIQTEESSASRPLFRAGNHPALVFNLSVPAPDPASIIDAVFMSPDNPGGVTPEMAKMIADARIKPVGSNERREAYEAISKVAYEDPHNIFVCWTPLLIVARKDVVGVDKTAYVNAVPIPDIRTYGIVKGSN